MAFLDFNRAETYRYDTFSVIILMILYLFLFLLSQNKQKEFLFHSNQKSNRPTSTAPKLRLPQVMS